MANKKPKILEDRAARILYLDIENSRMRISVFILDTLNTIGILPVLHGAG